MILAIDIGNTNISFGILKGKRVLKTWAVEVRANKKDLAGTVNKFFKGLLTKHKNIQHIVICSVVPSLDPLLGRCAKKAFNIKPLIVGKDLKVPIKNRYQPPKQVGQDRLVCSYAVKKLYGTPAIVIDFGTAITIDVISSKGEYLGGIIVPGIRLTAESLFAKTALLPKTDIHLPRSLIGKNTKESILSGIFYGYGALCQGLIERLIKAKNFKSKPKIVLTGGYAPLMKKFIHRTIHHHDPHLVLRGLSLMTLQSDGSL